MNRRHYPAFASIAGLIFIIIDFASFFPRMAGSGLIAGAILIGSAVIASELTSHRPKD